MRTTLLYLGLLATSAAAQPAAPADPTDAELKALVRDSVRFLDPKLNKATDYTYTIRNSRKQFESDGKLKSEEHTLALRTFQDGFAVTRLTERNGKPVPPEERQKQEVQISKRVAELKSQSLEERERRNKGPGRTTDWVKEIPEALQFKKVGEEILGGRRCWIVDAEPRPGYRATTTQARVFEKMKGRFSIDLTDRELVKAEAETFDAVNMGFGLLARMEKGTKFGLNRTRLADGNWVTESQRIRFGARLMLVKWLGNEIHTQMSDYRHKSQLAASR